MTKNKKLKNDFFTEQQEEIKKHSQRIHNIENCLEAKLFPTITPEWGDDLVQLIKQGIIPLSSLRIFLEYSPFSINYWNNIKGIYKLLEEMLIKLSQTKKRSNKHKYEITLILETLAIIFSRLEKQKDCSKCPGYYSQQRKQPTFCKNPCEKWRGGIRYARKYLNYKDKSFDKSEIINRYIKINGVHAAEIFIETKSSVEYVSLLLLVDTSINSEALKKFIELSQQFQEAQMLSQLQNIDFPNIDKIRIFHVHDHKHPWTSRGISHNGPRSYYFSHIRNELFADIRTFTDNAKPSDKTIQYMRRRCRRLLRTLQENNPDIYVDLCLNFFSHLEHPQKDKMSSQWLLSEIIFGLDKSLLQKKHGRGDIIYPQDLRQKTHCLGPCETSWNKAIIKIKPFITKGNSYLIITEFLIKIWNNQNIKKRQVWLGISAKVLDNYLQSSSKIIAHFAFEQLELKPEKIKKIQPSSIARGLATITIEDAEHYFKFFLQTQRKLLDPNWIVRFSFDFDDAIYSVCVSETEKQRWLILGLLSLQLPWHNTIIIQLMNHPWNNQKLPREIIKHINSPFQWDSMLRPSVWLNGKWKRPNLSQVKNGLIGWSHAIFDRAFEFHYEVLKIKERGINLEQYFLKADPERLLGLLSIQVHLLRCHGADVKLGSIQKEHRPKERWTSPFKRTLETIVDAEEGHYTDSDLRIEACKVCGSDAKNHAEFIGYYIEKHREQVQEYDRYIRAQRYSPRFRRLVRSNYYQGEMITTPKNKPSSFWAKVYEHKQNFETREASQWLHDEIVIALNLMINDREIEPELVKKINNITTKAINSGNDHILLKLIQKVPDLISVNTLIKGLIQINEDQWDMGFKNGKVLPKSLFESNKWIAIIWEKLGDKSDEKRELINKRFFNNQHLQPLIVKNFIPDQMQNLSDEQAEFLSFFIDARPQLFDIESDLLMKACLTPHSIVNEKALEFAKELGLTTPFALSLIESDLPQAVNLATEYFNNLDVNSSHFINHIVALCDSPHEQTRFLGLDLIDKNRNAIPLAQVLLQLKENRHTNIRRFIATELAKESLIVPDSVDFDIAILRSRNSERLTKELVKNRIENTLSYVNQTIPEDLIKSLRELSLGLIPKDREWSIKQLTKLQLKGQKIPEMEIENYKEAKNETSTIL